MEKFRIQVFVGTPQRLPESGRISAIAKQAVFNRVWVSQNGLAGDEQADLQVHGGPDKAVHIYAADHYGALAARFPQPRRRAWSSGVLGENLSVTGLSEDGVCLGDTWRWGEVLLQVCQPRMPCWKIDEQMGEDGVARYIDEMHFTGWYCRVLQAGFASEGDALELVARPALSITLAQALQTCARHPPDADALNALANAEGIAPKWASKIKQRAAYLLRSNRVGP